MFSTPNKKPAIIKTSPQSFGDSEECISNEETATKKRRVNVTPFWVNHPTVQIAMASAYRQIVPNESSEARNKWNDLSSLVRAYGIDATAIQLKARKDLLSSWRKNLEEHEAAEKVALTNDGSNSKIYKRPTVEAYLNEAMARLPRGSRPTLDDTTYNEHNYSPTTGASSCSPTDHKMDSTSSSRSSTSTSGNYVRNNTEKWLEKIASSMALLEGYQLRDGRVLERIAKAADIYCNNQRAANRADVVGAMAKMKANQKNKRMAVPKSKASFASQVASHAKERAAKKESKESKKEAKESKRQDKKKASEDDDDDDMESENSNGSDHDKSE